jgi:hydrogenase maturation factor
MQMFVDNAVVKKFEGEERYDRFAIASTMFDVSFKGASCSVIESKVLKSCEGCNLKCLCRKIDEIVEEYTEKTTMVTNTFNFNS